MIYGKSPPLPNQNMLKGLRSTCNMITANVDFPKAELPSKAFMLQK